MIDFSSFINLPFVWAVLIGVAVLMYVALDGFDLGVGILFPFAPTEECRTKMMNSVAPFWDGNETWLVLGGGGLFAAFPLAYSIIMPAVYLPIIFMLIGLIFRGVAFEFRHKSPDKHVKMWSVSFHAGSLLAAFMQGVILGNLVQGISVSGKSYAGGPWDWANSFAILNGLGVIFGYALLGSTWLTLKTTDITQDWSRKITPYILTFVVIFVLLVAVVMPFINTEIIRQKWLYMPWNILLAGIFILSLISVIWLYRDSYRPGHDLRPFILTHVLFLLGYIVLGVSIWPWIVPYQVNIWQAASAPTSLSLLLIGTVVFLPIVLFYTAYTYYVFRGKINNSELY